MPLRRWKHKATQWEKVFAIHVSNGLVSRACKDQKSVRKRQNLNIKICKNLEQALHKSEYPNS